jgi:hypothetical protein
MNSPGSGKTSLLERTIRMLHDEVPISVIEGDQATTNDAERIRAAGCRVVQINTGSGCHLEPDMLTRGLRHLDPARGRAMRGSVARDDVRRIFGGKTQAPMPRRRDRRNQRRALAIGAALLS